MPDRDHADVLDLGRAASLARTALTDPDGLPEAALEALRAAWAERGRERHVRYRLLDRPDPAPYVVDLLDDIIESLSPSTETREAFAYGLRVLGSHVSEIQNAMAGPSLDDPEPERSAYAEAVAKLEEALDLVDEAAQALHPLDG